MSDHGSADSVGNAYTTREGRGQGSRDSTAAFDRLQGSELHPTSSLETERFRDVETAAQGVQT